MTDDNLIAGIKLYGQYCAICHGTAKGGRSPSAFWMMSQIWSVGDID
jgi:mono/diheme cytochrome c family protein